MSFLSWFRASSPTRPVPPTPVPPQRVRLPHAYACIEDECQSIHEGLNHGKCWTCGSTAVFRIKSILDREQSRAVQRLKIAATLKAARERNDTALLTEFRAPDMA